MQRSFLRPLGSGCWILLALIVWQSAESRCHGQQSPQDAQGQPVRTTAEASKPDPAQEAVRQEVAEFFRQYESATQADNADELISLVDFEEFSKLVVEQAKIEVPDMVRKMLINRLVQGTRREFEVAADVWERHRVIQTTIFQDGKVVEAIVRSWSEDGESSRNIFWLEKRDRWRIVDWLYIDLGVKNSTLIGSILHETHDRTQSEDSIKTLELLNQGFIAARQQDIYTAYERLNAVTGRTLPSSLEGLRWIIRSSVDLFYDPLVTLESLDKAEAFEPEVVLSDFLRLKAYFELGEYDRVLHHAGRYLKRFGADDQTYLFMGMAHEELGQGEEAIVAYQRGLEDNPENLELVAQYLRALPVEQKEKIAAYLQKLPNLLDSFESIADEFEANGELVELKALLDAMITMEHQVPNQAYYESIVLLGQGEAAEAMDKLITARSLLVPDDDYLRYYDNAICRAAVASSQVMRAYDLCDDRVATFGWLVHSLGSLISNEESTADVRAQAAVTVKELVDRHLVSHATDWKTFEILGDHSYRFEDHEQAKLHFETALKYYQGDQEPYSLLYSLVACHVHSDSIMEFYKATDYKQIVFEHASYRLSSGEDAFEELQRLHRSNFPNLPDFVAERMKSLYEEKRYQDALDAGEHVDQVDEDDSYLLAPIRFMRIACLARLGRNDEAIILARQLDDEQRDLARAIVFAIRGDVKGFRGAVQRLSDREYEWSRESFTAWVDIPEAWFAGLEVQAADGDDSMMPESFDRYAEVRRLVFLSDQPILLEPAAIREAAAAAGLTVFEIHRDQLLTERDRYLCSLTDDAFLICCDGYKFFLMKRDGKWLNDLTAVGIEINEDDGNLQTRISQHSAWFSIDIFAWPQANGRKETAAIPVRGVRNMIHIAEKLLGAKATVAIHSDGFVAVGCDTDFFDRLKAAPNLDTMIGGDRDDGGETGQ